MKKIFLQHRIFIACLLSWVIIPLGAFFTIFIDGWNTYNLSGLLNSQKYSLYAYSISILLFIWINGSMLYFCDHNHHHKKLLILFDILALLAVCLPYDENNSILSSLHLACAYSSFVVFNYLFIKILYPTQTYISIYTGGMMLCVCFCMLQMQISGTAEMIFACTISILFGLLYYNKRLTS